MRARWLYSCGITLSLLSLTACVNPFHKPTNWNISLSRTDKKPYGSYLAYESLKYFYPDARLSPLSAGFRYNSIDGKMIIQGSGASLFVALGLDFYVTDAELERLISFASAGNEVMIFARVLDDKLEKYLGCSIRNNGYEEVPLTRHNDGSVNINSLTVTNRAGRKFGYQGKSLLGSFAVSQDTVQAENTNDDDNSDEIKHSVLPPDTLGFVKSQPDFIRYSIGDGHITLHAAPLVMSNYFLLQQDNYRYLEALWQTLPHNISTIYWNDYFKRSTKTADLSVLLKYPATRWALFLAVFALLIYVLFESKRKQRIIPVITPPDNSSVSFVETIGRLYFNKGDHTNLGEKMIQHFLEWVRTHYFMNTNQLNEQFKQQLTIKSGLDPSVVQSMMDMIREIHIERRQIDESELYHLYQTIQQFYKKYKA